MKLTIHTIILDDPEGMPLNQFVDISEEAICRQVIDYIKENNMWEITEGFNDETHDHPEEIMDIPNDPVKALEIFAEYNEEGPWVNRDWFHFDLTITRKEKNDVED